MIGQTISHYKILEKLGEGGMGVVYKAEDTRLNRTVALKFLPPELTRDKEAKQRFIHEAQAASALNHTNICSIHAIEEVENQQFIDMEFVEGKTLGALLKEKGLPLKALLAIALQIAEGLYAAHKKGIVHRDIKPDNIMVTDDRLVKIMDFGLAKLRGSSKFTKTHSTLGTLSYMSPEQAGGEEVDQRSDIFSFGAVLYEMITGRRPFKGEHEAAILYSVMNETPEPLARYKARVPAELQRVIDKSLAKDRDKRYQHVDEMITDLRSVVPEASANAVPAARRSNVPWIVAAGVVVLAVVGIYLFSRQSVPISADSKSIAVLPFTNMSENKEDEYFSDGITENIITDLAKIQGLRIIARNSAFQYKGENVDVKKVGKELDVRYVMEGSVQRSVNRLRINAQLIDAVSGFHLWADRYDRELKDAFAVQDEITGKIISELRVKLQASEPIAISSSRTASPEAYDLYLRGRFYYNQLTLESMNRALEYFRLALEKDPAYAAPYTGIAFAYEALADFYLPPREAYPRAKSAALKALELDSTNGEAHAALGVVLGQYEWDFSAGDRELRRAVQLSPNSVDVYFFYALGVGMTGRMDDALAAADRAMNLDPLSATASWVKEWILYWAHRYDDVIDQHRRTEKLDPNFLYWDCNVGAAYREKGALKEALGEYLKAQQFSPDRPLYGLAITYARMRRFAEARKILAALKDYSKKHYVPPDQIALIYVSLGENDRAFEWLDRACEARSAALTCLRYFPDYDPLRPDPRFAALLAKVESKK